MSIRQGQANAELRRTLFSAFLADGVTPATGLVAGDLRITLNGGPPVGVGGVVSGDGSGVYTYELSLAEVESAGFFAVQVVGLGMTLDWVIVDAVGDVFSVGETSPLLLRQPLVVRDDSGGLASDHGGPVETALNGVVFGPAAGSLVLVADGLHYYQGVASDAAAEGFLAIRHEGAGFATTVAHAVVGVPTASVSAGDITWLDVVDVAPELATGVSTRAKTKILGFVNERVAPRVFGGSTSFTFLLARSLLAAHMGLMNRLGSAGAGRGPVTSKSEGGASVSYGSLLGSDSRLLSMTTYGRQYLMLVEVSPVARAGFVTGPQWRLPSC